MSIIKRRNYYSRVKFPIRDDLYFLPVMNTLLPLHQNIRELFHVILVTSTQGSGFFLRIIGSRSWMFVCDILNFSLCTVYTCLIENI